ILMLSGNKLTFAVGKPTASAAGHTGNISISSNTWTHVVATWDTSGHHCIYVNGVLDIDVVNPSFKQINSVSTTALHIGSMAYSQRFFIGRIDDVKLFNKSLSASQVTDLYAENSIINNLISRFTFDEQNADDVVGGNHALATSASYTTDRFGNASKALNVSSTTFVNFNDAYDHFSTWSAGQVSYSFWINFTAINSAYQIMLGKSADAGCGGNDREFLFRLNPNSKLEITNYSSVTPGNYVVLQGTTTCTSNQWYHVVLTYNNANTGNAKFAIYLNGVQQTLSVANTAGLGMGTGFENGSSPLSVGAYLKSDGTICQNVQRLTAYFDDFEVYNKELSLSEVVAMYNAGNPVGVEDVVVTKDLTVFPNPFTNEITIKNSANMEGKIELIDLEGKILLTSFINEETSIVNTSEINPGMYLLILTNAEGKTVKKVVKY
ncbi:MAG TPA: LamG-like jellyroll fold domain-containing protein, partial [Bacteroidia bacterium]